MSAVSHYRFLDAMGDLVEERDFDAPGDALDWAVDGDGSEAEVQRVEYLGPEGDWRWAGALRG